MPAPSAGNLTRDRGAVPSRSRLARTVFAPPGLLAVSEAGADRENQRRGHRRAGEPQDQRPGEHRKGHERRDRVSRQADQRHAAHLAERDRPPGLIASRQKCSRPSRSIAALDMVLLAGRNAARGHDQIMPGAGRRQRIGERRLAVRADPEIADGAAQSAQQAPPA